MSHSDDERALNLEELSQVSGGISSPGMYRPGAYRDAALAYFKSRVGSETYDLAMSSIYGQRHHYVAARAFLSQEDWERFVWVEQHGSLDGFPG